MSNADRETVEKLKTLADSALASQSIALRAIGGSLLKMLCLVLLSLIERIEKLERGNDERS